MKLFCEIDKLNEKYIKFWQDVSNLESPTEDKAAVDACAKRFFDEAKALGFETEKSVVKESGDIVTITLNADSRERPITLSGHIDTVHPKGSFGTPAMEICNRNLELFSKINDIFEKNGLEKVTYRKSLGGSDAADVTSAGIPCIDSIGVEGDNIHTLREYAALSSLAGAAKRLACIIWDFD